MKYNKVLIYNKTEKCFISGRKINEFSICYADEQGNYISEESYKNLNVGVVFNG